MSNDRKKLLYALLPLVLIVLLSAMGLIYFDTVSTVEKSVYYGLFALLVGAFMLAILLLVLFVPKINKREIAVENTLNDFSQEPEILEDNIPLSHNQATIRFTPTGIYVLENELFMPYHSLKFRVFKQYHPLHQTPIFYLNFRQFVKEKELYIEDNCRLTSSVYHFIKFYDLSVENIALLFEGSKQEEVIEAVITSHGVALWKRLGIYLLAIIFGVILGILFPTVYVHFIVIVPLILFQQKFDAQKRKIIITNQAVHLGAVRKKQVKSSLVMPYSDIELVIEENQTLYIKTFYAVLDFPFDATLLMFLKNHIPKERFIKNDLASKVEMN